MPVRFLNPIASFGGRQTGTRKRPSPIPIRPQFGGPLSTRFAKSSQSEAQRRAIVSQVARLAEGPVWIGDGG